jgi:hypothetical protein
VAQSEYETVDGGNMSQQRNCSACGCDRFRCTDYDKVTKTLSEVGLRFKWLHADHGREKAEWELNKIRLEESMKWLQQKTKKQAQAITRLEAKLKKLGEQPYKEEGVAALEPGMVIFDGTTVVTRVEYKVPGTVVITGQVAPKD